MSLEMLFSTLLESVSAVAVPSVDVASIVPSTVSSFVLVMTSEGSVFSITF